MKEKNKKLIIIVSVLLLFGGLSFGYFASKFLSGGQGATASGKTATINGAKVTVTGNLEFNDLSIYPGHKNVSSITVTATGNNELIPYNLIWAGTNSLNTTLKYTVYKTSQSIDVKSNCEVKTKVVSGAQIINEECNLTNIDSLGDVISTGEITTNNSSTKITIAGDEFITATANGDTKYYYVILEYPNLETSQNEDIGGTFNGEVSVEGRNAKADINILATYIKQDDGTYKETQDIPQSGYALNTKKSTCSNGTIPGWDFNSKRFYADNLTKSGTSCYLYFDKAITVQEIIASKTVSTRTDFSTTLTTDTTGTIYSAEDDYGTSYYYAGNPSDNWVKFGGFYWRIIRINGDGTIRMIYNGPTTDQTGETTGIGSSAFNTNYNDNMYVGYMYTSGEVHGRGTDSTLKVQLDNWYNNNLKNYENYIATGGGASFCNDRQPSTEETSMNGGGGTGTTITYYAAKYRLYVNKAPTFKCADTRDRFATSVGLITADEAAYAGGVLYEKSNSSYYLYNGQYHRTMTPAQFGSHAHVFCIFADGMLGTPFVDDPNGYRPVINLKSDVTLTGTGTSSDPYIVS